MRLKKLASALSLTAVYMAGVALMGGCAEDRTTLSIIGISAFLPGTSCEPEASLSADMLGHGSYDSQSGAAYFAYLLLGNGIQPLGDNDTLRPETSRIALEGAEISITDGPTSINAFTTKFAGTINPDESEDPGVAAIPVPLIPAGADLEPGEYTINILVFGETYGGLTVESVEFGFPITVTAPGALIYCDDPEDAEDEIFHPCGSFGQEGYAYPCQRIPTTSCVDYCGL